MASALEISDKPSGVGPVEDLTDEQIEELLAGATARLKAKAQQQQLTTKTKSDLPLTFPKLNAGGIEKASERTLVDPVLRKKAEAGKKLEVPISTKKAAQEQKKATAGSNWFNMPKTEMTPELKRDLQLIKMRNVLDPHRHYKKEGGKMKAPEYSQVGTIIEGPTEFFSGRIENKKRKRTLVEEVLSGEQETGRFKKKYGDVQNKKTSGKKAFYTALKEKRKGGVKKASKG